MVSNSSLPPTGHSVFALDSEAEVMHLLASVRASSLTPAQKNELRDLIFLYTNGGRDESVKIALNQKIATYQVQPSAKPNRANPAPAQKTQPTIGTYRAAPTFSAPSFTPAAVSQPTPEPSTPPPVTPASPTPPPAPEPPAPPTPPPVVSVEPAIPPTSPVMEPATLAVDQASIDRIREIKAVVNEKFGNPVNLVEVNAEIGREYMSALLDAMKKINGGGVGTTAMARLEAAFQAIEKMENVPATSSAPDPAPAPATPMPEPVAPIEENIQKPSRPVVQVAANPPVVARVPSLGEQMNTPLTEPTSSVTPAHHDSAPATASSVNKVAINQTDVKREEKTTSVPISATQRPAFSTGDFSSQVRPVAAPIGTPPPIDPSNFSTPLTKSPATSDPLMSPEVDNGLQQLLEEWPIFKKSGLFGTGPKGREHPLFKKLAGLQIPLLLAGRFEGATQEIKQSITDYMNGWRYEQGIIYEQGEIFEHYLRRVIRHILDLQQNKV